MNSELRIVKVKFILIANKNHHKRAFLYCKDSGP